LRTADSKKRISFDLNKNGLCALLCFAASVRPV
jgi:hypothetical protein